MAIRPTTRSVTSTLQGGTQVGNHNKITNRNCAITNYITNITHVTNKCKACHPADQHEVSGDASRYRRPGSSVHTISRVRLVDCVGRELELGDLVSVERGPLVYIYIGNGMIIGLDTKTRKIVHENINVGKPFSSYSPTVMYKMYSRIQIVQRAKGKVGQKYDYGPVDFAFWCHTDMTLEELILHEGVQDTDAGVIYLRRVNAFH